MSARCKVLLLLPSLKPFLFVSHFFSHSQYAVKVVLVLLFSFPLFLSFRRGEKNIVEGNHPPFLPSLLLLLFLSPPKMSLCTLSHSTFHSFFSFFSTFGKRGGGASGFLRKNYCLCRRKRRKGGESIWAPTDRPTPSLWVFGFLGLLEIQTLSCVYDKPRTNCQNFDNKLYSLSKTTTTSSSTTTLTVFRQSGPKKGR